MKAPLPCCPAIFCFLSFAFICSTSPAGEKSTFPVGKWNLTFTDGVMEEVEILADGNVIVSGGNRATKGRVTKQNGAFSFQFDDNSAGIWSSDSSKNRMTVQRWQSASEMPGGAPLLGSAVQSDAEPVALEVHEWGTFTVLQGSDGQVIPWYQAPDKLVDLPPFVKRPIVVMGKSGLGFGQKDTVRMETPVLYFYPEETMDITVTAQMSRGRITEIFPPAYRPRFGGPTVWHGTLLPPDSLERDKVPAATGPRGRHYAAAREVPEAWLFRNTPLPTALPQEEKSTNTTSPVPEQIASDIQQPVSTTPPPTTTEEKPVIEPIDHFIFYRGAGNHGTFQLNTYQGDGPDDFTLSNYGEATIPKLFALRVQDGKACWLTLDNLQQVKHVEGKTLHRETITFPEPTRSATNVAEDLRSAMIDVLHAEGLTSDEATAMVNTWDSLWFTEPGTRVLAILPQQIADEMVPLSVVPKPTKIDRVFVARVEILTREVEQKLTSLLKTPNEDSDPITTANGANALAELQLGRYNAGGMERAVVLLERQLRNRFATMEQMLKEPTTTDDEDTLAAGVE